MTLVHVVVVVPATAATLRANVLTERERFIFHNFIPTTFFCFAVLVPSDAAVVSHAGAELAFLLKTRFSTSGLLDKNDNLPPSYQLTSQPQTLPGVLHQPPTSPLLPLLLIRGGVNMCRNGEDDGRGGGGGV